MVAGAAAAAVIPKAYYALFGASIGSGLLASQGPIVYRYVHSRYYNWKYYWKRFSFNQNRELNMSILAYISKNQKQIKGNSQICKLGFKEETGTDKGKNKVTDKGTDKGKDEEEDEDEDEDKVKHFVVKLPQFNKNYPFKTKWGIIYIRLITLNGLDIAGFELAVIKRSIRIVGVDPKSKWISSSFFLTSADGDTSYTYADCGVIPDPDSEQLASIAYEASNIHKLISGDDPKVAFLSFSTKGSAQHYTVKKIQKAMVLFAKRHPNILYEGELQFDAAINKDISRMKVKNSILKGEANTFIFPDLNSANIAYKISQHLAGFNAWGPLLQGFRKPIHDLSRGCSIDDIICVSAIAAMQSLNN